MKKLTGTLIICLALGFGITAPGGEPTPAEAPSAARTYCDWFDLATLYDNPEGVFIQSVALTGRLQAEAAFFSADQGNYEALVWRRFRFGAKVGFWQDFLLHIEADLDLNDVDPLYNRLTDAYLAWAPTDAFRLKVGKQSAGFTLDGATSSKRLLTLQRSNIANNLWFPVEYFTGIGVDGGIGPWSYLAGFYSGRADDELGDFEYFDAGEGQFFLVSLAYDLRGRTGLDEALVRLDYVHNDADPDSDGTRNLGNVGSLSLKLADERWGFWSDLAAGDGHLGQSDLWGLQLMPFFNFTERIQGVFRYTFLESLDNRGLRLGRYDNRIVSDRGDRYNDFYLGLNYYFCGHKLKVQTGVTYAEMEDSSDQGGDYDGWGWTTGVRTYW